MTKKTPLYQNHIDLGAKMGPFAGYDMPLFYQEGALKEHEWVRTHTGLFDVSHMGQVVIHGPNAMAFIHKICPSDFTSAPEGRAKYTVLLNEQGGIVDDMIVTRMDAECFFVVINAGRKAEDLVWMQQQIIDGATISVLEDRALIAVQGIGAEKIVKECFGFDCSEQPYMWFQTFPYAEDEKIYVSRLGYTGEDGFELSVPNAHAGTVWDKLLESGEVKPAGLVSRDTLRLEMGYPLYGHDLDDTITPIEASLGWVVSKHNESFLGHDVIRGQQKNGAGRIRVGIELTDKGIAREGAQLLSEDGTEIGMLTSGGFSPVLQKGIGQGYVDPAYAKTGAIVKVVVRNREIAARVAPLSFVSAKTKSMKMKAA